MVGEGSVRLREPVGQSVPKTRRKRVLPFFLLFLMFVLNLQIRQLEAREVIDMAGRRVSVPDTIKKVFSGSPPATYMIYVMDPTLLAGLNFPLSQMEKRFLSPIIDTIPVIGGWFGQGRTPNLETLLSVKADLMVIWMWKAASTNEKVEELAARLRLPLVYITVNHLTDYPEAFRFLGELLGRPKRARELCEYATKALSPLKPLASGIPDGKKISVYYAEAPDGLSTECDKSLHAELINLAGGRNIYQCEPKNDYGMERISIEQVMAENPNVIVAQEKEFVDRVYTDPRWQSISAVKNRRIHLIPRLPFNWFDRPPSFMRILGVRWLANILYPEHFPIDLAGETREFYDLFLGIRFDDAALSEVLRQ